MQIAPNPPYHRATGCMAGPLALKLWSSRSPGFKGENDEVLKIVKAVYAATGGKGSVVYDRGGDRPAFYDCFIEENRDFIVRLKGRSVLSWGGMHEVHDLARRSIRRTLFLHRNRQHASTGED